jgi:hypothetical protein
MGGDEVRDRLGFDLADAAAVRCRRFGEVGRVVHQHLCQLARKCRQTMAKAVGDDDFPVGVAGVSVLGADGQQPALQSEASGGDAPRPVRPRVSMVPRRSAPPAPAGSVDAGSQVASVGVRDAQTTCASYCLYVFYIQTACTKTRQQWIAHPALVRHSAH